MASRDRGLVGRARPTDALPGTCEKIAVLQERAARRLPLHAPGDARLTGGKSLVWARAGANLFRVVGVTEMAPEPGEKGTTVPCSFGETLRRHREAQRITVKALAYRSGLSIRAVGMMERDERLPTLATLVALADALNLTLDALAGRRSVG